MCCGSPVRPMNSPEKCCRYSFRAAAVSRSASTLIITTRTSLSSGFDCLRRASFCSDVGQTSGTMREAEEHQRRRAAQRAEAEAPSILIGELEVGDRFRRRLQHHAVEGGERRVVGFGEGARRRDHAGSNSYRKMRHRPLLRGLPACSCRLYFAGGEGAIVDAHLIDTAIEVLPVDAVAADLERVGGGSDVGCRGSTATCVPLT